MTGWSFRGRLVVGGQIDLGGLRVAGCSPRRVSSAARAAPAGGDPFLAAVGRQAAAAAGIAALAPGQGGRLPGRRDAMRPDDRVTGASCLSQ
jgi:hypothetical protein